MAQSVKVKGAGTKQASWELTTPSGLSQYLRMRAK